MSPPEPTAEARTLKAGQRVFLGHLGDWFKLATDARPHRRSAGVTVLEFDEIPDEYRPAAAPVRVRSADPAL